ncbi:MAG: SAF domain-containing protein [Anaerolineales bacterium]|nr:SAF domain-containing protein [Anaerolineales bacterium]
MPGDSYPTTTPDWQAAVRRRSRFYTVAALLLAVLFGILTFHFFNRQDVIKAEDLTSAVFASRKIPAGTVLKADDVETRKVPKTGLPEACFQAEAQLLGKEVIYPLISGEIINPKNLASEQGGPIAQRCSPERWCIRIPEDWFIARPPQVAPGDVLEITAAHPGQSRDQVGFIAVDVQVIAVLDETAPAAYVLAVRDQEALALLFARSNEFHLLVLLKPTGG